MTVRRVCILCGWSKDFNSTADADKQYRAHREWVHGVVYASGSEAERGP